MKRQSRPRNLGFERAVEVKSEGNGLKLFLCMGGVLGFVLLASLTFVWLQDTTHGLVQQVEMKQKRLEVTTKQVNNLRMEVAHLESGRFIARQVERFNLGLDQAAPGQVRRVHLDGADQDVGRNDTQVAMLYPGERNSSMD